MERVKAPEPGLYYDIPFEQYALWDAVCHSSIKGICMGEAAVHYKADLDNEDAHEDTVAKAFGRVGHVALLQPELLSDKFVVQPETYINDKDEEKPWNWNANVCKTWRDRHAERGLEVVKSADMRRAGLMAVSARGHPRVAELFDGARFEVSFVWKDPGSGLLCKGRADILHPELGVADPKTTRHRLPYKFARQAYYLGYHIQSAMYTDGLSLLLDAHNPASEPVPFTFISIEKAYPYVANVFDGHAGFSETENTTYPQGYLKVGRDAYRGELQYIAHCMIHDDWPDYGTDIQEMVIPKGAGLEM